MNKTVRQNYRMVFSDIDGTLLTSDHQITPDTKAEILKLADAGIPFVLVSARMPEAIRTLQQQIGNHAPIICYSGALVQDADGKTLFSQPIELELAGEIKQRLTVDFPQLCCSIYGGSKWLVDDEQNPWIIRDEAITMQKSLVGDLREVFHAAQGIHKLLVCGEPEDVLQAEMYLKQNYPELSAVRSLPTYLEVMDGRVGKDVGIHVLCDYYGVSVEQVLAFGDGYNDIGMLKAVKHSYAMGNAPQEVKDSAAYVAEDHDQEGLMKVLKECFTIPG